MYNGTINDTPDIARRTGRTPKSIVGGYELYFDDNNTINGLGRLRNATLANLITDRDEFRGDLTDGDNVTGTEYDIKVWP
jgi:hypothetical protein